MIEVTTLGKHKMWINPDLIRSFDQTPDTTICLTDGSRIPVLESPIELRNLILHYRRQIFENLNQQQGNV